MKLEITRLRRRNFAALAALGRVATLPVPVATHYVEQRAGSDRNSGTSPSSAWKNVPDMNPCNGSGRLSRGDSVYFDSDDTRSVSGTQGIYLVRGVTDIGNEWGNGTRARQRASPNRIMCGHFPHGDM